MKFLHTMIRVKDIGKINGFLHESFKYEVRPQKAS